MKRRAQTADSPRKIAARLLDARRLDRALVDSGHITAPTSDRGQPERKHPRPCAVFSGLGASASPVPERLRLLLSKQEATVLRDGREVTVSAAIRHSCSSQVHAVPPFARSLLTLSLSHHARAPHSFSAFLFFFFRHRGSSRT